MSNNPKKPSVTKAFKEVVYPLLKEDGYKQLSLKTYARLVDNEVLQVIFLHVDSRLRRSYEVHYCTLLISEPHEALSLELGGRFEKLSSGYSYGASTEKLLNTTIERVAIAYKEEASKKLQDYASLNGIKDAYLSLKKSENYINAHTLFSLACVYAVLDDINESKKYAKEAYDEYKSEHNSYPDREWTLDKMEKSQALINSLETDDYKNILKKWREFTISNLKLEKL